MPINNSSAEPCLSVFFRLRRKMVLLPVYEQLLFSFTIVKIKAVRVFKVQTREMNNYSKETDFPMLPKTMLECDVWPK